MPLYGAPVRRVDALRTVLRIGKARDDFLHDLRRSTAAPNETRPARVFGADGLAHYARYGNSRAAQVRREPGVVRIQTNVN